MKRFILIPAFLLSIGILEAADTVKLSIPPDQVALLAAEPQWLKLLHYKKRIFGGFKSRARKGTFFYHENGKYDPESELKATLEAFARPAGSEPNDHATCRFPARYKWLKARMPVLFKDMPEVSCPKYQEFFRKAAAKAVSLVFVSADVNEPASMFGHTFVRLPKDDLNIDANRDQSFSYVAHVDSTNILSYMYYGAVSGFQGKVEYLVFGERNRIYNIAENRNMWELRLNFTQEEVDRVVDHTWEFKSAQFDYLFWDENCAYYNLDILEVGRPDIDVADRFVYYVIPSDTIRGILRYEGLLKHAAYYPANMNDYLHNYNALTSQERKVFAELIRSKRLQPAEGVRIPLIIHTAIAYQLLRVDRSGKLADADQQTAEVYRKLQEQYGPPEKTFTAADWTNPTIGHRTTAVGLSGGYNQAGYYTTLSFRPVMHGLTESPLGYALFSDISAFQGEIRYNIDQQRLDFEKFDLVRIISLKSVAPHYFQGSWLLHIGAQSLREYETSTVNAPINFFGKFGYGLGYQPGFLPETFLFYGLLGAAVAGSSYYEYGYNFPPFVTGGILWNVADNIALHLESEYNYFFFSQLYNQNAKVNAAINYMIADSFSGEVRYEYNLTTRTTDWRLITKYYF